MNKDLSKETIAALWKQKQDSDERARLRNKRHEEIHSLFMSSNLPEVKPLWHNDFKRIDLNKQRNKLRNELLVSGMHIIVDINIEILFDKMMPGNPEMFREKNLYNEDLSDIQISDVVYHWINKIELIPPTIMVMDKLMDNSYENEKEFKLFPIDGKHRLNVAYYFGAATIPILVINEQLSKIKSILNLH